MVGEEAIVIRAVMAETTQHAAFLQLISEYEPALRRLAGAYFREPADREDLFQEIAMALWQALPRFRGESSTRTWLYRIAHNVAISTVARQYRRRKRETGMDEASASRFGGRDAEQETLHKEKLQLLTEAIRNLSVIDRQIILLHLEGLNYAELLEVTGISESAVAARLTRIRDKLRDEIKKEAFER